MRSFFREVWDRLSRRPSACGTSTMSLSQLSARVRELDAKEEIRELFRRYGFTADLGDAEGWSKVWASDARFELPRGAIEGREAFRASIADANGIHKLKIEGRGSLHTTSELTIEVDGDKAWAEGAAIVWIRDDGRYRPFTVSYNHWDLVRSDDRWEIAYRFALPVAPGNAQLVWKKRA